MKDMRIKRRFIRWQVDFPVKIKINGKEEGFIDAKLKDISFKGAQLLLHQKLPEDKFLNLTLILADKSLEVQVWLVWRRVIDGHYLYGLYFTKIKDSDKEIIYRFVQQHHLATLAKQWWQDRIEKGGEEMEDRRIFARFPVEFSLRYLDLAKNREGIALTKDISAKGIGLVASEELAPCTPLEMWLEIPDRGEPLYTRGEVVWSKVAESNKYRAGIELEKADLMGLSRVLRVA